MNKIAALMYRPKSKEYSLSKKSSETHSVHTDLIKNEWISKSSKTTTS